MTQGQVDDAERKALNELDRWNDVTGFLEPGTSYYYEIQAVIEDAVHIGIQMALHGKVSYDNDKNVVKKSINNL